MDSTLDLLGSTLGADDPAALERFARRLTGRMAAVLPGSLLVRHASPEVADVFCASRSGPTYDGTSGALTGGGLPAIIARSTPSA